MRICSSLGQLLCQNSYFSDGGNRSEQRYLHESNFLTDTFFKRDTFSHGDIMLSIIIVCFIEQPLFGKS